MSGADRPNAAAYDALAGVYDRFQQAIEPDAWAALIDRLYRKMAQPHDPQGSGGRPLLLDLGCGTGRMTAAFVPLGYDIIGLDLSPDMLAEAGRQIGEAGGRPLLLLQDLCDFELYGTVDLIICLLDTVNHITDAAELAQMFSQCANYLNPGGVLVFDAGTRHHFETTLGDGEFFAVEPDHALLWQNTFDAARGLSRSELTVFDELPDGVYIRRDVCIEERFYEPDQLAGWLAAAGFCDIRLIGDREALSGPGDSDERFFIAARSAKPVTAAFRGAGGL